MSLLSQKHLQDEEEAYAWVEACVWPNGPVCPHCKGTERISKMHGNATRIGLYKCYACRKQFNVKVGTIFEASHVKMHIWMQAFYLISSSKKGISANQLHRTFGVTLKTGWFMGHRIREAMRTGTLAPIGGPDGMVEADETFIGRSKEKSKTARGYEHKQKVLSLVERGGDIRSFKIAKANAKTIKPIVDANVRKESVLMTDEASYYRGIGKEFKHHFAVEHGAGEYVRGSAHTNTLEGFFSIFKRGMKGIYQHCDERHLHRYLAEFDFRYNNRIARGIDDKARAEKAVKGIVGKRLTYRTADQGTRP
jgi:transposase-like protein